MRELLYAEALRGYSLKGATGPEVKFLTRVQR